MRFGFGKTNKERQLYKGKDRRYRSGKKRFFECEDQPTKCICSECGFAVPHEHRVQCFKLRCPKCASIMTRSFLD